MKIDVIASEGVPDDCAMLVPDVGTALTAADLARLQRLPVTAWPDEIAKILASKVVVVRNIGRDPERARVSESGGASEPAPALPPVPPDDDDKGEP